MREYHSRSNSFGRVKRDIFHTQHHTANEYQVRPYSTFLLSTLTTAGFFLVCSLYIKVSIYNGVCYLWKNGCKVILVLIQKDCFRISWPVENNEGHHIMFVCYLKYFIFNRREWAFFLHFQIKLSVYQYTMFFACSSLVQIRTSNPRSWLCEVIGHLNPVAMFLTGGRWQCY